MAFAFGPIFLISLFDNEKGKKQIALSLLLFWNDNQNMDKEQAWDIVRSLDRKGRSAPLSESDVYQREEALHYLCEVEGDSEAMACLGGLYYEAEKYPLAEKYYLMSYENGNKYIASGLGFIYFYGRVGTPDYEKAFRYFSEAKELGDKEAAMKIADMYERGLGVEKDEKKYEGILRELWKELENSRDLFDPVPEIAHRLAYLDMQREENEEAAELLNRGWIFIVQRIYYSAFWGNFIVARRTEKLLGELGLVDEETPRIFDLFYCLREPRKYSLLYGGRRYSISSFEDEGKTRVQFGEKVFASIEDFLRQAVVGGKYIYSLEYNGDYLLRRKRP